MEAECLLSRGQSLLQIHGDCSSLTAHYKLVVHMKSISACQGIPEILISYNGPYYLSREFSEFAKDMSSAVSHPVHITHKVIGKQKEPLGQSMVPTTKALQTLDFIPAKLEIRIKVKQIKDFNSCHRARELSPLESGDRIWVPERGSEAEVCEEVAQ